MILDVVKNMMNRIVVSSMTADSAKKLSTDPSSDFTLFDESDSFLWKVTKDNATAFLTLSFKVPVNFRNMAWVITGKASPMVNVFFTYDDLTFYEFNYFTYRLTGDVSDPVLSDILKEFAGRTIKVNKFGDRVQYVVFDQDTLKVSEYDQDKMAMLKNYIEPRRVSGDSSVVWCNYQFQYFDKYLNEKVSLFDKPIKGIKLYLSAITEDVSLVSFEVMADVTISEIPADLALIADNFFRPKYFEEYPFIPSIAKTFFDMLQYTPVGN